jgi:hypothetical protein
MASAYFIKGRTEPIDGAKDKFGSITFAVLYEVPSNDAADLWATEFVTERLLRRRPEQRLIETVVAPLHSHLLTASGEFEIDWPLLAVEAKDKFDKNERGCTAGFMAGGPVENDSLALESTTKWIETVKSRTSNPDRFNWNERKQFLYVAYHSHQAHIVRAMNLIHVHRVYCFCVPASSVEKIRIGIKAWPGAIRWPNLRE